MSTQLIDVNGNIKGLKMNDKDITFDHTENQKIKIDIPVPNIMGFKTPVILSHKQNKDGLFLIIGEKDDFTDDKESCNRCGHKLCRCED